MRWTRKLRLRVRSLLRSSQVERELDEELRYHLEHLVDDYVAAGMLSGGRSLRSPARDGRDRAAERRVP